MQMLQPAGVLGDDDLEATYAYPAERTWTRLNFVASVDGGTADPTGRADGLTSPGDQRVFHLLRSLADVIVVGAGTARTEGYARVRPGEVDADLRARLGLAPLPPIAVVSRSLELADDLLDGPAGTAGTLVVTTAAAPPDRLAAVRARAEVLVCGEQAVDLGAFREQLATRGLRRILCEGGPELAGALAAARLLDELCLTVSPLLLAGGARRLAAGPPVEPPLRLRLASALVSDADHLLLRYTRAEEC